jgi:hypothetical protein
MECPGGYQVTPDNSTCIRCLPGMNVSASEPYICQGTCKGEKFNETCCASCNRGHSFHGGCLQLCESTAGECSGAAGLLAVQQRTCAYGTWRDMHSCLAAALGFLTNN